MRRRGAVLAKRGRGRGPRLPRLWMVGFISLALALGVVVWKQRHRFLESVAPKAPSILVDVDKDKPVLIKVFFGSPTASGWRPRPAQSTPPPTGTPRSSKPSWSCSRGPAAHWCPSSPQAPA